MQGFDEKQCALFIRRELGESADDYTDDELLYVVDLIWDYYEKKGLLSLSDFSDEEEELLDEDELIKYVKIELRKLDGEVSLAEGDIPAIVKAELKYEESLEDIF